MIADSEARKRWIYSSFPRKAGIQGAGRDHWPLGPRFRGGDGGAEGKRHGELCGERWDAARLLRRRFYRPVEERANPLAAARGDGQRPPLLRLGSATQPALSGGAVGSAGAR